MTPGKSDILFDKFSIQSCIKKDSYSGIYIADHIYLGKKIFLKTLDQESLSNPSILQRFQREAKLLAKLDHPNIIKVYDFGTSGQWFYISFEYFKSRDLRKVLRESTLTDQQKLDIFIGITQGLSAAHDLSIIHRDIKPENILVNDQGKVKIADFGLALIEDEPHETHQESIVGTPGYMSPEQIRGEVLTPSSDLFSLGIVGCELITGKNPFLGHDAGETLNNILSSNCSPHLNERKHTSDEFCAIVQQLVNKKTTERPVSATAILTALQVEQIKVEISSNHIKSRSKKRPVIVLLIVFLGIVPGMIWFLGRQGPVKDDLLVTVPDTTRVQQVPVADENIASDRPVQNAAETIKDIAENVSVDSTPVPAVPGILDIRCVPWAEVWINSEYVDTTPLENEIELLPGEYKLALVHPEYPDYVQTIRIGPKSVNNISVNLDTLCGYLQCELYPFGDVYVDSVHYGVTPLPGLLRLSPGIHQLNVKNEAFGIVTESITIIRNDTLKYRFNFEKLVSDSE